MILLEDFAALVGLVFALFGVGLTLLTRNGMFDVIGTAAIGVLLVAVASTLALETKSLLLGEAAGTEAVARIEAAITGTPGVERLIHMKRHCTSVRRRSWSRPTSPSRRPRPRSTSRV